MLKTVLKHDTFGTASSIRFSRNTLPYGVPFGMVHAPDQPEGSWFSFHLPIFGIQLAAA